MIVTLVGPFCAARGERRSGRVLSTTDVLLSLSQLFSATGVPPENQKVPRNRFCSGTGMFREGCWLWSATREIPLTLVANKGWWNNNFPCRQVFLKKGKILKDTDTIASFSLADVSHSGASPALLFPDRDSNLPCRAPL